MNVSLKGIQKDIGHLTGKEVSVKCVVIKFVHWESKKGRRFGKLVVKDKRKTDAHFHRQTHTLLPGFLIAQTLGMWSAIKLFFQIFNLFIIQLFAKLFRKL